MEYNDILALWYTYASANYALPYCVSFRSEDAAIQEAHFFKAVANRLKLQDDWQVEGKALETDSPMTQEKAGAIRWYVRVVR